MRHLLTAASCVLALACGDDAGSDGAADAAVRDGGSGAADAGHERSDAGAADAAAADAGAADAAAMDSGAATDAATPADLGASPCDGLVFGSACRDACAGGYECVDGVCLPGRSRAICGGFAGAMCTTRAFPNCLYYESSDYGPCLSEEERACACAELGDRFDCPRR